MPDFWDHDHHALKVFTLKDQFDTLVIPYM